jgi:hypothetical protein
MKAAMASFLKSKIKVHTEGTSTRDFLNTTDASAALKKYKTKRKFTEEDDTVLVDDNSDDEKMKRQTPMEERKPKIVFF